MYCLMCGEKKTEVSFKDIVYSDDPLCSVCRKKWEKKRYHFMLEGIRVDSDYIYNEAFADCLVQFKECYDEALKDVFLYEVKKRLRRMYHGYTLCLMPSAKWKMEERGFSHLRLMYENVGLPILEPFEKIEEVDQKKAGYQQRTAMTKNIRLKQGIQLPKKIVLCDDTLTTGSTFIGALSSLPRAKHQIRIYSLSINRRRIG